MQNASECSRVAVHAIADQLGIDIRDNIINLVAQDAEYRIQEYIKRAVILHKKTHTPKLTVQHVNMVIESFRVPPLLGYSSTLPYNTTTIPIAEDNDELLIVEDKKVDLVDAAKKITKPAPRPVPFYFQWAMVNGISIDRRNTPANRNPFQSPADLLFHHSFSDSIETQQLTNEDVITPELQSHFKHAIDIFESNDREQLNSIFNDLSRYSGIQPLLPLFLQFFAYKLMVNLDDNSILERICFYLYGLIDNLSLPIHFFVHPILRIIMTIILKFDCGSDYDIASDIELRKHCCEIIDILCSRCVSGFPNIKTVISNAMMQTLFNPETTLCAHYGALLAIQQLGKDVIVKIALHIPFYVNCLKRELLIPKLSEEKKLQVDLMNKVLEQLKCILDLIKDYDIQSTSKCQATMATINEIFQMIKDYDLVNTQ
ncbi:hypothetical protein M9Y10_023479 [Tritrichomonas musculus]|uniref:TATA box binding protein associated factor (TAF) histone-like fold domain-containing protein n=1 Tax=Tritrichomonas musculus TaxID=1915356 RepID=A0ABR2KX47_9EUKA